MLYVSPLRRYLASLVNTNGLEYKNREEWGMVINQYVLNSNPLRNYWDSISIIVNGIP